MSSVKIVFIGASYKFNHRVFKDLVKLPELRGSTVTIFDIKKEPLEIVSQVCEIIKRKTNADLKIESTLNRRKALEGADFVLSSFNVGIESADKEVIDVCMKYNISHGIGDTIGPSALVRSFRNIYSTLNICRDMEKYCPKAWYINFSNPMSAITLAVNKYSKIKGIGLCHAIFGSQELIAKTYNVSKDDVQLFAAGVNHLTWVLEVYVKGENKISHLYKDITNYLAKQRKIKEKMEKVDWHRREFLEEEWKLTMSLFEKYGYLPVGGDVHVAEFFPYFFDPKTKHGLDFGIKPVNMRERIKQKSSLKKLLLKWISGKEDPWDLDKFSGEDAHSIILSILMNKNDIHQVNIPNYGSIDNVPKGGLVEVPALFGCYGYKPISLGNMPPHLASITTNLVTIHNYTVDAIVKRDKKLAIQALLLDPLVKDFKKVDKLLNDLLESQKRFLPKFY